MLSVLPWQTMSCTEVFVQPIFVLAAHVSPREPRSFKPSDTYEQLYLRLPEPAKLTPRRLKCFPKGKPTIGIECALFRLKVLDPSSGQ